MATFTQLNPTIPLRSPKASGEAIGVIDYSIEHDLMWVIVDDNTGQIWTVPNKDVRAYKNYSAGRDTVDEVTNERRVDSARGQEVQDYLDEGGLQGTFNWDDGTI